MFQEVEQRSNWKISQVINEESEFENMFFAGRSIGKQWCSIRGNLYEEHAYLHTDGVARKSLQHGNIWSGYFESHEAIKAVIDVGTIKYEID